MDRRVVVGKATIIVASSILLLLLMTWVPVVFAAPQKQASLLVHDAGAAIVQGTPTEDPTVTALNKEKLAQSVIQLQNQNTWWWNFSATIVTAVVAFLVAIFGILQWFGNRVQAQDKDLKDRTDERAKQAEERFEKVVDGLGSDKLETSAGAAILLRTFLQPGYKQFHRQVFDLVIGYLRLQPLSSEPPSALSQALTTTFIDSTKLVRDSSKIELVPKDLTDERLVYLSLDARRVHLDSADLYQSELTQAWMSEAYLRKASLEKARLDAAVLEDAHLENANLKDAILENAILTGIYLSEADLTNAHLSGANLSGAHLSGAQLKGADLTKADLGVGQDLNGNDYPSADLTGANPEAAKSLEGTIMRGVTGLTEEQIEACKKKGAIFIETAAGSNHAPAPN